MKRINKIFAGIMAFTILISSVLANEDKGINEMWGKPTFVYGKGLSDSEIENTKKLLSIKNDENINSTYVDGKDELRYLVNGVGDDSQMISSALVQKTDKGGIKIEIVTKENITQITENQYENAAITAGVNNVNIKIASVKKVTGESALVGIFKAFEVNGEKLDSERMKVAQNELETSNMIVQENKNKEGFDAAKWNQVIINIKQEISNYYNENKDTADAKEVEKFITDSIQKYDLENTISEDQIQNLQKLFEDYQNTGAVDSKEVLEQLSSLSASIGEKAGKVLQDAKESGVLDKILGFFMGIIDAIRKAISK